MSSGLLALLDDIAALAKVAAVTLDDAATQVAKAGSKAAGIVIDDAAVTPRYVVGFAADRELPIIARIAWGSLKNKLLYLLPAAIALSALAPWLITPLLMIGGLFLCFEGYEKAHEWILPHGAAKEIASLASTPAPTPAASKALEDEKVAGAIRTDLILSAEIMAIALSTITAPTLVTKALILGMVGIAITVIVYGAVALIVKADDLGMALAQRGRTSAGRALGRGLVQGMPPFLKALSTIGTLAMLWVGGDIILHGLATLGLTGPEHMVLTAKAAAGGGAVGWLVGATLAGLVGLALGWLVALALSHIVLPVLRQTRGSGHH